MAWRVAKSLLKLREQVDEKWPNRDKSSDGTIGDASHQATNSDHNPNAAGVVTAMDITHDPAHGLDARKLAETLVASRDSRIKYIISNRQIISSVVSPWEWRPYTGSNPHDHHVHISVNGSAGLYDDERAWNLGAAPAKVPGRNYGITATRFNDSSVAYADVAPGWNNRMGVSLPYRFKGARPKVRVFKGGKSIVCEIMDIGPWYDGTAARGPFDPYWETGARPRAESDSRTNGAGIDLTFPADAALGVNGKGLVDWEFVTATTSPQPEPEPSQPMSDIDVAEAKVIAAVHELRAIAEAAATQVVIPPSAGFDLSMLDSVPDDLVTLLLPKVRMLPDATIIDIKHKAAAGSLGFMDLAGLLNLSLLDIAAVLAALGKAGFSLPSAAPNNLPATYQPNSGGGLFDIFIRNLLPTGR